MDRNNKNNNKKDNDDTDKKKKSSLSQLEQDIQAKNRGRGTGSTQPGAVSSSGPNNNASLSQLERDLAAKQTGSRSRTVTARPGAVSVTAQQTAAATNNNNNHSLSQLEQDIAAKKRARKDPPTTNAPKLTQLEQDIAAKQGARPSTISTTSKPGAVRSNGLSQLEQDIAAKSSASVSAKMPASSSSNIANQNPSLSRLEQDIAAKGTKPPSASRPGAVAAGGNNTMTQLERDIAAKSSAGHNNPSLTQLERDVVAKTQARGVASSRPGATAAASNGLSQLERDIVQKTSSGAMGGNSTAQTNLTQLESDLLSKTRAGGDRKQPPPPVSSDAMVKQTALRSGGGNRSTLSHLENEILRKNGPQTMPMQQQPSYPSYDTNDNVASYDDGNHNIMDNNPLEEGTYDTRPEEAPIYPQPGDSVEEGGGIEAFVAEPNVVDAEAVEVIRTDEEEEVEAKKRQKKFLTILILAAITLLTIVIVPVALTTRKKNVTTPAPTLSPTASPTMAPTTQDIPILANDLRQYVQDVDDLTTRGTAQNSAMFWIATDDQYVIERGWDVQDERFIQRFILAIIYFSLNGDDWRSCHRNDQTCSADGSQQSWLTNTDECTWNLIDCDENNRVISFDNSAAARSVETDMFGIMPQEFSQLTSMREILLGDVGVKGALLTFLDDMPNMETLVLRDSDFSGTIPSDFASKHTLLTSFDVHGNKMTGSIPDLSALQAVTLLDLSGNSIIGSIPSSVGNLSMLTRLDLRSNDLTGEIPPGVYSLTDLTVIDLGANLIRGSIPTEIGNLSKLVEVSLGPSLMTGSLPSELFSLTGLKVLRLQDSSFSGSLRNEDFIQIADTITLLFLENNDFSGPIPIDAWESVEVLHQFFVYGNPKLTGTITQTLCEKRGTFATQIEEMVVGCNILCVEGCCADKDCPDWLVNQSDLPE